MASHTGPPCTGAGKGRKSRKRLQWLYCVRVAGGAFPRYTRLYAFSPLRAPAPSCFSMNFCERSLSLFVRERSHGRLLDQLTSARVLGNDCNINRFSYPKHTDPTVASDGSRMRWGSAFLTVPCFPNFFFYCRHSAIQLQEGKQWKKALLLPCWVLRCCFCSCQQNILLFTAAAVEWSLPRAPHRVSTFMRRLPGPEMWQVDWGKQKHQTNPLSFVMRLLVSRDIDSPGALLPRGMEGL